MQQDGHHNTRTLLVSTINSTKIIVGRGSIGNIDAPTTKEISGRT